MAARRTIAVSAVLLGGCWSDSARPTIVAVSSPPACVESEGPVRIRICRRGTDVDWRVLNDTEHTIFALAAPQDMHCCPSLQAAYATIDAQGTLLLRKVQLPANAWVGGEPSYTGFREVKAHDELSDSIHIGRYLNPRDPEIPVQVGPARVRIRSIMLEVGWLDDMPGSDSSGRWQRLDADVIARRQHLARSPVLPWR